MKEQMQEMRSYGALFVLMCCLVARNVFVAGDTLPTCQPSDFHYEYTECDSEGGRWRVSVPKPNTCIGGAPNPPVRGKNCEFTCKAGQFLDLKDDQSCQNCPAGTYSLGGGLRFEYWETLPKSFSVTSEDFGAAMMWGGSPSKSKVNCAKAAWKARGGNLYAMPQSCTTILTYSTKLVRAGHVTFEYQNPDPDAIFHFVVQNDQCATMIDSGADVFPDNTVEDEWGSVTVQLNAGPNVLKWKVTGNMFEMAGSHSPILIRKIEIAGVAFTSECTKCRNGTYSSGGTAFCAPCGANKFSDRGAAQCQDCQSDEYSEPGSGSCTKRPPCTRYDYFEHQTPCDENKQTRKIYKWIEPKICNEQAEGSVSLPPNTDLKPCPPCNPGMYPVNISHCEFCSEGFYSDGSETCKQCPVSTSPEYGIDYRSWTVMPPNVTTHCLTLGVGKCSDNTGWQPAEGYVTTTFGPADRDTYLLLDLIIGGFRSDSSSTSSSALETQTTTGKVTFSMEVNCTVQCQILFLSNGTGRNNVIKSWTGSIERQEFTFDVKASGLTSLTWAFQPIADHEDKDEEDEGDKKDIEPSEIRSTDSTKPMISMRGMDSVARIYSIKVANTIGGGATRCIACPQGNTENGCVPCPDGQYVDKATVQCVNCPPGTVLPSSNSWGQESCRPCGEGLKAVEKRVCKSDCLFTDRAGRFYDFTALDGVHFVQGGRLFTSSGTMYYHGFNLTLCNAKNDALPVCSNNVTAGSQMLNLPAKVEGMICRSTLIPQPDPAKPLVSTQPVSLATRPTKIVTNVSLADMYNMGGFPAEGSELDVHFFYTSETPTMACPKGRTTIISLHCDPDVKANNSIQVPPKCSDGTCDGCTFHFLWHTQHACPRCKQEDLDIIRGECVNGEQLIHFYPPKYCLPLDGESMKPMKKKCKVIPFAVMVAIPMALGIGLILILLLIYCWSRNRKLEYKYSKLVSSSGGRDGELPAAESCGMEEGEEEEAVHFSNSKGPKILQKIRLKISGLKNKDDDDSPFVAMQMHEKLPLT